MKKSLILILSFVCSLLLSSHTRAQGYKIAVHLQENQDTTVYLAHYFDGRIFADDTAKLVKGKALFSKDTLLDQGIYVVYLPSQKYFDVLIGKDQEFSVTANPENFIESLRIDGAEESKKFHDFQQFMKAQNEKSQALQEAFKTKDLDEAKKEEYRKAYKKADKEVREYIRKLKDENPDNSFVGKFAQFTLSPEIPDFSTKIPDSVADREKKIQQKSYLYNKDHYFDYLDFTDNRFLRTPVLKNKLDFFYEKILVQNPDSLFKEASKLIEKSRPNKDFFQYMTQYSLNHSVQSKVMGMDAAFVKLAKKYYLSGDASWADSTLLANIRERVIKLQFNLLGMKGQDLNLQTPEGEYVRLHEVDASYTVLYFWEPDCGHCEKLTPRLKSEIYDVYKGIGLKVFAVCTQDKKEKWENFIADHDLFDFINCYDPYYQSNFRIFYDVYSTPILYLLDKDKKIIAKRLDIDTLKIFLDHELNQNK